MDYIHDDEDVFEIIPPMDAASAALKDPRGKISAGTASSRNIDAVAIRENPCHQPRQKQLSRWPETKTNTKTPVSTERNIVRIVVTIMGAAVAVGLVVVLFGRGGASRDLIEVLRLEFKRDLESLRSDVEHELGARLLAAAAVQTAASARSIELKFEREHHHNNAGIENNGIDTNIGIAQVLSTIDFCSPQDILRNAGHRLQEGLSQPEAFPDMILRKLQIIYLVTINSDWIQSTTLRRSINFANQYSLEAGVWFAAFLLILYNCFRWVRGTNRCAGLGTDDTTHESSNPVKDEKCSDECPTDRNEDVMMEHMFDESVAAAIALPAIVVPRIYTGGNRTRNSRIRDASGTVTTPKSADPSPILGPVNSNSKKERIIRARINAQEFAARDKQRLTSKSITASTNVTTGTGKCAAAAPATKPNANGDARVMLAVAAAAAPALSPSPALPSPWISKRARLKQARVNAKLYAEQDKQRLREAAADDPWKKRRRRQQN
jgi:hypothetical protein